MSRKQKFEIPGQLSDSTQRGFESLAPLPDIRVSEWADRNRILSKESSAEPGRWNTSRAEYQREIMNSICDPVEEIIIMASSQIGKSEILLNQIGFLIDHDPCPVLCVHPTVVMAQSWSKDRLSPMIRDCATLRSKVKQPKTRDSGNVILHKKFPGGHITVSGANSPASLAQRPVRVIVLDDCDRFPPSAGSEGDPAQLASRRSVTFWNHRTIMASTPTIKGESRIEKEFNLSDQRRFYVQCPLCNEPQVLRWPFVKWKNDDPATAYIECQGCGGHLSDQDRLAMVQRGKWIAENPATTRIRGYHISELYSPWSLLKNIVQNFLTAKKDPQTLRVFINTVLGETWEENRGEGVEVSYLLNRKEDFGPQYPGPEGRMKYYLPEKALVMTVGCDVHDDSIMAETVAWGKQEESWSMDYQTFYGDPGQLEIWHNLGLYLQESWFFESGEGLHIDRCFIDSGGHFTQAVYDFCRFWQAKGIFPIKGVREKRGGRIVTMGKGDDKTLIFTIQVDSLKDLLYSRLKIREGPGCVHFPTDREDQWFFELTAEKAVTKFSNGFEHRIWVMKGPKNEGLDCRVYAQAALRSLGPEVFRAAEIRLEDWRKRNQAKQIQRHNKPTQHMLNDYQKPTPNSGERRVISRGISLEDY
jgi:phage terminase large subunit GpA-like protein